MSKEKYGKFFNGKQKSRNNLDAAIPGEDETVTVQKIVEPKIKHIPEPREEIRRPKVGTVVGCSFLNVRQKPSIDSKIEHILKRDEKFVIMRESEGLWLTIRIDGISKELYILKSYSKEL